VPPSILATWPPPRDSVAVRKRLAIIISAIVIAVTTATACTVVENLEPVLTVVERMPVLASNMPSAIAMMAAVANATARNASPNSNTSHRVERREAS